VNAFKAIEGRGVQADLSGETVYVGGPQLLESLQVQLPEELLAFSRKANQKGQSVVHLIREGQAVASFALADILRPESRKAVEDLHAMGIKVAMLTGDSQDVARAVGD